MHALTRRAFLRTAGGATAATLLGGRLPAAALAGARHTAGYVGNGTGGAGEAFPIGAVKLLDSPFRGNQSRNTSYLHFVDPDRLLHTFRLNVGLPSSADPCGGWEAPSVELRGHSTGHLLSGLALTHANTGDSAAAEKGRRIVAALAECQAQSPAAGFHSGYLSAFPESFFDRLEARTDVWAPYYTIHKLLAGLIDQHQLVGNRQALKVARRLADWIDWRTSRLSYTQMQSVLETEFGGVMESLANLAHITRDPRLLTVARRFDHARMFDPLERDEDRLAGNHANTQIPKMIGAERVWEETGLDRYRKVAANFWQIVVDHHTYIIGGNSDGEAFHEPDAIAAHLSNGTCENCNSYNMLKLTRLLHFHDPSRIELLDYYERTLFNQMLGEQDPESEHGFNIYYTGLSAGAFKQQPSFMGSDPNVYSTDYGNFSCDHGTGMETQAKFADTIYSRDARGVYVNLFIPSEVSWPERGITLRQETDFPDEPSTRIRVVDGSATLSLRVRIPGWVATAPEVRVNGHRHPHGAEPGRWLTVRRRWRRGDVLEVTLPMALALNPTPDDPEVTAVTYGPVVLSGAYGDRAFMPMPRLDTDSVERTGEDLTFAAQADGKSVELLPIARMHHQHYTVYWRTGAPPPPPAEFAAWYKLDETTGTTASDSSGAGHAATLAGGASWTPAGRLAGALALDGHDGHLVLPEGVITGALAYSVAAWVKLDAAPAWSRIFDFGTGTGANMFLTPRSGSGTLRYAITIGGSGGEQQINAPALPTGAWKHIAVTHDGESVGVLYVDGKEVGRNEAMPVVPQWFGSHVTQNYVGRSQYSDPYLPGAVDDFRVYGKALTPAEVTQLASAG